MWRLEKFNKKELNKSWYFRDVLISSINLWLVKPDQVSIDGFLPSNKAGCTRCVQWQPLDTVKCPVEYNIQFRNRYGKILGNVTNVRNNVKFYCTDDYVNSFSVTMWATFKSIKGIKSQVTLLCAIGKTVIHDKKGM